MNQKELKELIEFLIEKDIAEFEMERGDVKVRIKRGATEVHYAAPAPVAHAPAPAAHAPQAGGPPAGGPGLVAAAPEAVEEAGLHVVHSPIVGTFYESPSPGAPAFCKVGDAVETGQVLCIIEAMKLMNEIESDYSGEVVKRFVANAQPVEYNQPLFAIRPK